MDIARFEHSPSGQLVQITCEVNLYGHIRVRNNVEKLIELNILRQLGDASYSRVFIAENILQIIAADQAPTEE